MKKRDIVIARYGEVRRRRTTEPISDRCPLRRNICTLHKITRNHKDVWRIRVCLYEDAFGDIRVKWWSRMDVRTMEQAYGHA
jgi:hypothetical protein